MSRHRILASSAIFHGLNDGATVAVPMVFPLLLSQAHILKNYSQVGLMSHLGLLATFFFQIIIVQVAHQIRYQHLLLASFLGISLTLGLFPQAETFVLFLFIYLFFRVCDSFYHTLGLAWVSRAHLTGGMDLAMGIQSGSGNLGVFLAFIFTGSLAQSFAWQTPLYFWSGLCFVAGFISYLLVRKLNLPAETSEPPSWLSWKHTFSLIKLYLPGFIFAGGGWGTVVYYAPSLLHHRFSVAMGQTGLILAAWIGLGTLITYLFGPLSRLLGRVFLARLGLLGSLFALLLIGLAHNIFLAQLGLYSFGLFLFLILPALQASVGDKVPPSNQSQAFSLVSNIQIIAGAIFPSCRPTLRPGQYPGPFSHDGAHGFTGSLV